MKEEIQVKENILIEKKEKRKSRKRSIKLILEKEKNKIISKYDYPSEIKLSKFEIDQNKGKK
jgi:hypothetical protein